MDAQAVIRVTQLLNLLHACLMHYTDNQQTITKDVFEKFFVYAYSWAIGGLFETEDRQKFHKEILEKLNAPLPQISPQKQNFDKETVFDYWIDPESKQWCLW